MEKASIRQKRGNQMPLTKVPALGYVAIFLKEFGVSRLLKKKEYSRYHKKKIVANPDVGLLVLASAYSAKASLFTKSKFVAPDCFVRRWAVGSKAHDPIRCRSCTTRVHI
jgi:hypothetical protein